MGGLARSCQISTQLQSLSHNLACSNNTNQLLSSVPYASFKEFKLHYEDSPAREGDNGRLPIMMLHGFTLDHRMWLDDAEYFSQWYRVILPDFKGHGKSDAPESGYSRAHRVEEMVGLLDHFAIQKVHVVGLSMGGTTALGMALKYPDLLGSLTLVSTSAAGFDPGPKIRKIDEIAKTKGIEEARERWIKSTLRYFGGEQKSIRDLLETMMRQHSGAFWKDPMRGKYPVENDLERVHEISLPTLIFAGESDRPFLPLARELHEKIANSRLSIFPLTGHMLNLESPIKFRREVKLLLEGQ